MRSVAVGVQEVAEFHDGGSTPVRAQDGHLQQTLDFSEPVFEFPLGPLEIFNWASVARLKFLFCNIELRREILRALEGCRELPDPGHGTLVDISLS
ncbi:hypothetical protein [Archangium sp.]|uniref:hypothetical protein n=1 Tax=Archangium sp. TaxID=1872627 RepID=UPI002D51F8AB|nr:hypothetical protein [Archangium sp.]HYO53257.1 hypothetical protein [Archangium sp.]